LQDGLVPVPDEKEHAVGMAFADSPVFQPYGIRWSSASRTWMAATIEALEEVIKQKRYYIKTRSGPKGKDETFRAVKPYLVKDRLCAPALFLSATTTTRASERSATVVDLPVVG
jgi:hypothetical protein